MKKLVRFHFGKQNYRDFLAILPYGEELPEFYGFQAQKIGWSNTAQGCRNIARKYKHLGAVEKDPAGRIKAILLAEMEASGIRKKQTLEWEEHRKKFQGVKYK